MSYQKLLKTIAKENKTTEKAVDYEMRKALKSAGINIEPSIFISLISSKVKKTISHN